jgi:hypothetical protein
MATMASAQCEVEWNIPVPVIPFTIGESVWLGMDLTFDLITRNSDRYYTVNVAGGKVTKATATSYCTS